jgi:hypothetical protein
MSVGKPPFERCQAKSGCPAAQLEGAHCLEHVTEQELEVVGTRLRAGEPLDARNTTISAERIQALLDALRGEDLSVLPDVRFDGAAFSGDASFDRATFSGYASFYGATFNGDTDFNGATFSGYASFYGATFNGDAAFDGATFNGETDFDRAIFSGYAGFDGATFSDGARFVETIFSDAADFDGAIFSDDARFVETTFSDDARFNRATFSADAAFDRATFKGTVMFAGLSFERDASLARASFERARELGPFMVGSGLVLDDCVFMERVRLEVAARVVSARATTFAAGALLRVRWAEIALDDSDFARPSTLSGATTWRADNDLPPVCLLDDRHIELEPRPRLLTLRGAHIATLSLSNVDLRACRFTSSVAGRSSALAPQALAPAERRE